MDASASQSAGSPPLSEGEGGREGVKGGREGGGGGREGEREREGHKGGKRDARRS